MNHTEHQPSKNKSTEQQWAYLVATRLWALSNHRDTLSLQSLKPAFFELIQQLIAIKNTHQIGIYNDHQVKYKTLSIIEISTALFHLFHVITPKSITNNTSKPIVVIQLNNAHFILLAKNLKNIHQTINFIRQKQLLKTKVNHSILSQTDWKINQSKSYTNEQKQAIYTIATQGICLLSGGAGTGKSSTLSKAVSVIFDQNPQTKLLLCAPTGKAVHRLTELIAQQKNQNVNIVDAINSNRISIQTLHKALGISETQSAYFNAQNPLNYDVIIVDESSMVSTELLIQLQNAMLSHTRLTLVGDRYQLPAIGSCSFFNLLSDLPSHYTQSFVHHMTLSLKQHLPFNENHTETPNLMTNSLCKLSQVKRFDEQSNVHQLANTILNHDYKQLNLNNPQLIKPIQDINTLIDTLKNNYPNSSFTQAVKQNIILCNTRKYNLGSDSINQALDDWFRQYLGHSLKNTWYEGRPIIVEKNDYQLDIYNGDIGYCIQHNGQFMIAFSNHRLLPVDTLSAVQYSLAYAISIHKSQGSEYDNVQIVLSTQNQHQSNITHILKPLLYTAITRAKKQVCLYTDADISALFLDSARQNNIFEYLS